MGSGRAALGCGIVMRQELACAGLAKIALQQLSIDVEQVDHHQSIENAAEHWIDVEPQQTRVQLGFCL